MSIPMSSHKPLHVIVKQSSDGVVVRDLAKVKTRSIITITNDKLAPKQAKQREPYPLKEWQQPTRSMRDWTVDEVVEFISQDPTLEVGSKELIFFLVRS
jgi:hypothetical protein